MCIARSLQTLRGIGCLSSHTGCCRGMCTGPQHLTCLLCPPYMRPEGRHQHKGMGVEVVTQGWGMGATARDGRDVGQGWRGWGMAVLTRMKALQTEDATADAPVARREIARRGALRRKTVCPAPALEKTSGLVSPRALARTAGGCKLCAAGRRPRAQPAAFPFLNQSCDSQESDSRLSSSWPHVHLVPQLTMKWRKATAFTLSKVSELYIISISSTCRPEGQARCSTGLLSASGLSALLLRPLVSISASRNLMASTAPRALAEG